MYKIEKNIAIPTAKPSPYPFAEMQVGDSFLGDMEHEAKIRAAAYNYGNKTSRVMKVRRVEGGVRCWRLS